MLGHADDAVKTIQCRGFLAVSRVKHNLSLAFAPGFEWYENGLA